MERVHYYQEQSLPELKAFAHKGIFSKAEIRKILKKRTEFESALIRRVAKKGDYLRYAAYEMSLEALRRKRLKTLNLPPSPPSAADFALVRRQFYILERAVRKFKADIGLWVQYIDVAKREGARALVGRICARALQLHPNEPALYILSSSHELSQLSPTAARALLQRGLRINAESIELWTEYLKMELGYVETLRRRWEVLGISQKEPQPQDDLEASESARKQIMDGAIAKTVIANAVKAIPKIPLFTLLQKLLSTYPTPLRALLLAELHDHLHRVLPSDPHARLLHATRSLTEALEGEELVDRLKEANQDLVAAVREAQDGRMADLYATWVRERVEQIDETNLRLYLLHSLHAIPASLPEEKLSPGLLSTHLDLLISPAHPSPPSPEKVLKLARKYTSQIPSSAAIWVARLKVEKQLATPEATRTAWAQAREHADGEGVEDVWLWGLADLHAEDVEDTFAVSLPCTTTRPRRPSARISAKHAL
ncbi:hypothetical protein BOTBODRAFT_99309 [Botryobasidium botryosum FD-172 SS1]|uniref:U3 small nucleolar RNA-associated protein 6 N-terminal domain-containing protein n=1 Tax=Botryobasidium botryosum (strain FD-172 SS1) TaxID=930990 RepID=A0A067N4G3_BOTB1|nr:hypothetical protein BOTBODRAFT_99309 [Botryobasidium botryosum FD-172 SS1]